MLEIHENRQAQMTATIRRHFRAGGGGAH
jgi:hypothetical protein